MGEAEFKVIKEKAMSCDLTGTRGRKGKNIKCYFELQSACYLYIHAVAQSLCDDKSSIK